MKKIELCPEFDDHVERWRYHHNRGWDDKMNSILSKAGILRRDQQRRERPHPVSCQCPACRPFIYPR